MLILINPSSMVSSSWDLSLACSAFGMYCLAKAICIQLIDNFFRHREPVLLQLPNADYFAHLAQTCFDVCAFAELSGKKPADAVKIRNLFRYNKELK
jgi:hypothetical protein